LTRFITICTQERAELFGEITVGAGLVSAQVLNNAGEMIGRIWQRSYYEHVIRDDTDYQTKLQYIDDNPQDGQMTSTM